VCTTGFWIRPCPDTSYIFRTPVSMRAWYRGPLSRSCVAVCSLKAVMMLLLEARPVYDLSIMIEGP
jgi:hypothetical protein